MMICTGVFLIGMMSDYLLGEAAEGGGLIRQGEYVEYLPPENQRGMQKAFLLEPKGIRRLESLQYRVRVNFSTTRYEGEVFEDNVITYDAGTNKVVTIDYDFLRERLNNEFKLQWNRPLNNALIIVGRELMPAEFPQETWETSVFLQSDEFQNRKKEKLATWQVKADKEGWSFFFPVLEFIGLQKDGRLPCFLRKFGWHQLAPHYNQRIVQRPIPLQFEFVVQPFAQKVIINCDHLVRARIVRDHVVLKYLALVSSG
jgi:hypothetical protein